MPYLHIVCPLHSVFAVQFKRSTEEYGTQPQKARVSVSYSFGLIITLWMCAHACTHAHIHTCTRTHTHTHTHTRTCTHNSLFLPLYLSQTLTSFQHLLGTLLLSQSVSNPGYAPPTSYPRPSQSRQQPVHQWSR